jgi:sugar/nucleoside kinase (ribokinase family)
VRRDGVGIHAGRDPTLVGGKSEPRCGSRGEGRHDLPPPRAVDTTQSADSFNADIAASLKGEPPEYGVASGHALAARVAQHVGALIPAAAMPPSV